MIYQCPKCLLFKPETEYSTRPNREGKKLKASTCNQCLSIHSRLKRGTLTPQEVGPQNQEILWFKEPTPEDTVYKLTCYEFWTDRVTLRELSGLSRKVIDAALDTLVRRHYLVTRYSPHWWDGEAPQWRRTFLKFNDLLQETDMDDLRDWDSVDWDLPVKSIMAIMDCSRSTVDRRRKIAHPNAKKYNRYAWDSVNWEKELDNHQVADRLGASVITVRQKRKEIAPHTIRML